MKKFCSLLPISKNNFILKRILLLSMIVSGLWLDVNLLEGQEASKAFQHWQTKVPSSWTNGILNANNSDYFEGEVVPHVYFFTDNKPLQTDQPYTFTITYDYWQSNTNAGGFAYITTYDLSKQPTIDFAAIKDDNFNDPDDIVKGDFYTFDADITAVRFYPAANTGDNQRSVEITFNYNGNSDFAVFYFGLYIAKPGEIPDQGSGRTNGASAWTGGSLRTVIGGSALSLSPAGIIDGEIAGYKFNDLNGNGINDAGEPGLEGWMIQLSALSNFSSIITSVLTDGNGYYTFSVTPDADKSDMDNDPYYVREIVQTDNGWTQISPSSGYYGPLTVSELTPQFLNQNFGNFQGKITGYKWNDLNGNGIKDGSETFLSGWTIRLCADPAGSTTLISTTTDLNGYYEFIVSQDANKGDVDNDPYYVFEENRTGWVQTFPASGYYGPLTIAPTTQQYLNQNFGNFEMSATLTLDKAVSSITDVNANGLNDAGDIINYSFAVTAPVTNNVDILNVVINDSKVTATCLATTLAPGASTTCTGSYTILASDVTAGFVTNTATASGVTESGAPVTSNQDSETVTTTLEVATLTLVKTASPSSFTKVGDIITYSYLVTNTGNVTLYNVSVVDDKATVTCPATSTGLAPGASITCSASYTIKQSDLDAGSVTNKAYATDGKTRSNEDSETVTFNNLPPTVVCPAMPIVTPCSNVVTGLAATISDPNDNIVSLTWTMIGATIASGINNLDTYTFGWGTTRVTYLVTDSKGLVASCYFDVTVTPCDAYGHCTYTQGFYGNPGGKTCDGSIAMDLMTAAFGNGTLQYKDFGGTTKYFRLYYTDITNESIFKMLPGGGKPAPLRGIATYSPEGNLSWSNVPISTKSTNYGTINNSLLAQTIVLWFNMQNDAGLGSLVIEKRYIVTAEGESCGSDVPLPGTEKYAAIPSSIYKYFGNDGFTVAELFNLANRILGGSLSAKVISWSDVEKAVDAINNVFDQCRVLVRFSDTDPSLDQITATETTGSTSTDTSEPVSRLTTSTFDLKIYPNPFAVSTSFEITMHQDAKVRLEIYTNSIQLVSVLLNESLKAGDVRTVMFDASRYPRTSFIYRITVGNQTKSGILLRTY